MLRELGKRWGRALRKITGIKTVRRGNDEQNVVIVVREKRQHLAERVEVEGTHGREVQTGQGHELPFRSHRQGHERVEQFLRREFGRVEFHLVKKGESGIRADLLARRPNGKRFEIVLLPEKQIP